MSRYWVASSKDDPGWPRSAHDWMIFTTSFFYFIYFFKNFWGQKPSHTQHWWPIFRFMWLRIALANCDCLRRTTCDWRPMCDDIGTHHEYTSSGPDCQGCHKRNTSLFLELWPGWFDSIHLLVNSSNEGTGASTRTYAPNIYTRRLLALPRGVGVCATICHRSCEWMRYQRIFCTENQIDSPHVNRQLCSLRRIIQIYGDWEGIQQGETSVDSSSCCVLYVINLPGHQRWT